jgi:DNA-binding response OmpR family regulator
LLQKLQQPLDTVHGRIKPDKNRTRGKNDLRNILIIDDDIHIGNMLEETLTKEGYAISRAYSGTEAVLVLSKTKPDLILLDLMLPGLSGEEVLSQIKGIPVIVVSAKVDVDNKVDLLLGGAADYVTKPFDIKELLARIAVQFRKSSASSQISALTFDDIVLDMDTHIVAIADREIKLTRTEYAILKLLMQTPSHVVTKSQLLDSIGEDTPDCTESSLKTHISHLRGKLRDAGGKDYIEAVWGIGFKMKEN